MFWLLAIIIFTLALTLPLLRLFFHSEKNNIDVSELNLSLHYERLNELKNDLKNDLLSEQEFSEAKQELASNLASDLKASNNITSIKSKNSQLSFSTAIVIVVLALLITFPLFKYLSSDIYFMETQVGENSEQAKAAYNEIPGLAVAISSDVFNSDLWRVLGRQYMMMSRPSEAIQAYERALYLGRSDDIDMYIDMFDAHLFINNGSMHGDAERIINAAYDIAPDNAMVLVRKGLVAFQKREYDQALTYMTQAKQALLANPDKHPGVSPDDIERLIVTMQQRRGGSAPQTETATQEEISTSETPQTPAAMTSIQIEVRLDPGLLESTQPTDVVFILATAVNGPRAPLAVKRIQVKDLPVSISLSDANAMVEGMNLSSFDQVKITARISKSGRPIAASGDMFGSFGPINPKQVKKPIAITINSIVP